MFHKIIFKTTKFSVKQPNLTKGAIVDYLIVICVLCPIFLLSAHLALSAPIMLYTHIPCFLLPRKYKREDGLSSDKESQSLSSIGFIHTCPICVFIYRVYLSVLKSPVRRALFASRDIEYCRYYPSLLDIANLSPLG